MVVCLWSLFYSSLDALSVEQLSMILTAIMELIYIAEFELLMQKDIAYSMLNFFVLIVSSNFVMYCLYSKFKTRYKNF